MSNYLQRIAKVLGNHRRKAIVLTFATFVTILVVIFRPMGRSFNMEIPTPERYAAAIEMAEIVLRNREVIRSNRMEIANYSVLKDPYYVVQRDRFTSDRSPAPACEQVQLKYSSFKLCPHSPDDPMMVMLRVGWQHDFEISEVVRIMQEVPNAAFIDIGANVGFYLNAVLLSTGYGVKAVAVEPMPNNLRSLMAALDANNVPRDSYALIERALADTVDDKLNFGAHPSGTLGAIIGKTVPQYTKDVIEVRTATIDSHVLPVAKAMNITTAILKIDVEGAECTALQSAKKFLASVYVPYIIAEHLLDHVLDHSCIEKAHQMLRGMSYYPYYDFVHDPKRMLDTSAYKKWGFPVFEKLGLYADIVWKKIL